MHNEVAQAAAPGQDSTLTQPNTGVTRIAPPIYTHTVHLQGPGEPVTDSFDMLGHMVVSREDGLITSVSIRDDHNNVLETVAVSDPNRLKTLALNTKLIVGLVELLEGYSAALALMRAKDPG